MTIGKSRISLNEKIEASIAIIRKGEKLKFESTKWTDEQIKQFKDLMVRFSYDSMCIGWNRCHEFLNQEKEQHTISKFRKQ